MRVHRILAEASGDLLREVFDDGHVLDRAVAAAFRKNPKWGKRDRNFVAESVWDVVRWRRVFEFLGDSEEVGALLAACWQGKGFEVPEWWNWMGGSLQSMRQREGELPKQSRAVRESIPDWLDALAERELGEAWDRILQGLNRRAPVFLRANTLTTTRDELQAMLEREGVLSEAVAEMPDALRLDGMLPKRFAADGRMEIQDGGSQLIAPMLGVEPGMKVIDACAGAGGKTLHLAALMGGQGEILALDVSGPKLKQLKERAARAGVRNVKVDRWDSSTLATYRGWADRVLIDAPCSGLGTLRRQPDLKWRLEETRLAKVKRTQRKLLDHYPELLRPGGSFVYATCSVLPSENQGQIGSLLERDPRWELADELTVSPAASDFDGFYAARCIPKAG